MFSKSQLEELSKQQQQNFQICAQAYTLSRTLNPTTHPNVDTRHWEQRLRDISLWDYRATCQTIGAHSLNAVHGANRIMEIFNMPEFTNHTDSLKFSKSYFKQKQEISKKRKTEVLESPATITRLLSLFEFDESLAPYIRHCKNLFF